jgi:hypothetical protein
MLATFSQKKHDVIAADTQANVFWKGKTRVLRRLV